MLLGAHMSIAGGIDKALVRGKEVGCDVIQIFTKSNNRWETKPFREKEIKCFYAIQEQENISCIAAHVSYLINCATPNASLLRKSRSSLLIEMKRADELRIPYLIMHPGSHCGSSEADGIKRVGDSLNGVMSKMSNSSVSILIETTAGQGSAIGYRFEQLQDIIERVEAKNRIGICFDTCHVFAAGYDVRVKRKYKKTFSLFDTIIGLKQIKVFHFNDSKRDLGSRIDRHEHIGKGYLGYQSFRLLLHDQRFQAIPKILETPKGQDLKEDKVNLHILRNLMSA